MKRFNINLTQLRTRHQLNRAVLIDSKKMFEDVYFQDVEFADKIALLLNENEKNKK